MFELFIMWTGHFEVWHENCIYLSNCKKFNVSISMYPMNTYTEGRFRYQTNLCVFDGIQKNIDSFMESLKKDKRCISIHGSGNTYLTYIKFEITDHHSTNYFTPKLFLLRPIVHANKKDKYVEDWYIASWEKEFIVEFYNTFKKHFEIKMLSIKQEKFPNLYIPTVMPKLTQKQKDAVTLAILHNYYSFPRKTDLEKLAKKMNISRVTFQEHLRKAESKLLPSLFGYTKKDRNK